MKRVAAEAARWLAEDKARGIHTACHYAIWADLDKATKWVAMDDERCANEAENVQVRLRLQAESVQRHLTKSPTVTSVEAPTTEVKRDELATETFELEKM
jgi:hypothetical protein